MLAYSPNRPKNAKFKVKIEDMLKLQSSKSAPKLRHASFIKKTNDLIK